MKADVPMFSISNDELENKEPLHVGDMLTCTRCGEVHEVIGSTPPMLLSVRCGDSLYLVGIKDRKI